MKLSEVLPLFVYKALWRTLGLRSAGRALVRALGAEDEDARTIAGMFLVQAGKQAEPLLEEALNKRENLPMVLTILGDIGDRKFEPELHQFSQDRDPQVAKAARNALSTLNAQSNLG